MGVHLKIEKRRSHTTMLRSGRQVRRVEVVRGISIVDQSSKCLWSPAARLCHPGIFML
ncbi:MAG: hypothetical protein JW836_09500 [Deltaproteobacteria bacterium]|nr:hypothetical protein [Deltaproteobacteria bacterium]